MDGKSKAAVEKAVEEMRLAMIAGDIPELSRLAADELIHGHTSGRTENKQQFIEGVTKGRSQFAVINLSEQTVTVLDDVAVVHHIFYGVRKDPKPGEKPNNMKVLGVWIYRQNQWKIVARQSVNIKE